MRHRPRAIYPKRIHATEKGTLIIARGKLKMPAIPG
jgi:hypothetical protein